MSWRFISLILVASFALPALVRSHSKPPLVTVVPEVVVKSGEPFNFTCKTAAPIKLCLIKHGDTELNLKENSKSETYKYHGETFKRGECGIKYFSASQDLNGEFTCIVTFADIQHETSKSINVTVLATPENITFINKKDEYVLGQPSDLICAVFGGNPPPRLDVYLGGQKYPTKKENNFTQSGRLGTEVEVQIDPKIEDNGKVLECRTSQANSLESVSVNTTLYVCFGPQPIKKIGRFIQKEGLIEGNDGIIEVNIHANPKPHFHWEVDGHTTSNRIQYEAMKTLKNETDGSWTARLKIRKFATSDERKNYTLIAKNKCGEDRYEIRLKAATLWFRYLVFSIFVVLLIIAILMGAILFRKLNKCFKADASDVAKDGERNSINPSLQSLLKNLEITLDECDSDNEMCKLAVEFQNLATENLPSADKQPGKYSAALDPINKGKNRFKHIMPYDLSRVKLKTFKDGSSDYINASFIKGFSGKTEYIAAQAPLPKTVADFWQMIFENDVCVIVMATNLREKGLDKCCKYYPNAHCGARYGKVSVECVAHKDFPHFSQSTFRVKGSREAGAHASWNVVHVHIKNWSDVEFPNRQILISFLTNVREYIAFLERKVILVHCSGGTGRTGTLIALDILLQEIRAKNYCDVYGTISTLRKQRMNIVHTEAQYKFIHECLRDFILREIDRRADSCFEERTQNSSEYLMPPEHIDYHIYDYPVFPQAKSKPNAADERTYLKILEN